MFFVTVIEEDIQNGLNSGGINFKESPEKMAKFMANILLKYLVQSNEYLKLNKSFQIVIKLATKKTR